MSKSKFLVLGVPGDVQTAIERANAINAKSGPFDGLILLGAAISIPPNCECAIPLYIYGAPDVPQPENDDRITLIRPGSSIKTVSGIKIGAAADNVEYTGAEVDILITTKWPKGIDVTIEKDENTSDHIAEAVKRSKPRYCFCSAGNYHERAPFRNGDGYTRFINLGAFGGGSKWFYAFNIGLDSADVPPGATETPWNKRKIENTEDGSQRKSGKKRKERKRPVVTPDTCFFCLSCPQLDKNLIVSIADETYLALAKGPLTTPQRNGSLGCSAHALIIPIPHIATYSQISEDSRDASELERKKYMVALKELYDQHECVPVAIEISRSNGVHVHTQVVPVPRDKSSSVEQAFEDEAGKMGYAIHKRSVDVDETEYFKVILPSDETMVIELRDVKFDLQFGRKVLAKLIGLKERVDWRACEQTPLEESKDAEKFKTVFQPFDFTI